MSTNRTRPILVAGIATAGVIGVVSATVVSAASPAASTPATHYAFTGDAFGSRLQATPSAASGRSAYLTLGCTPTTGVKHADSTENAQQTAAGHVGSVSTTTSTRRASGKSPAASVSTSTVHGMKLLGGVVQATAIKAVSTVSVGGARKGTTTFVNLRIDGHKEESTPKPNQTYQIPSVGSVVLNAQRATHGAGASGLIVNGLELTAAAGNPGGLPAKSQVVLAHAKAAVEPVGADVLHGNGFGSAVIASNNVTSGRTFSQPLACGGTAGKTRRNTGSGAAVSQQSAIGAGSVVSTANGSHTATTDVGTTTSTVHHLSLIGAMVSATAIKAVTHVSDNNGAVTTSELGSQFVGLKVNGKKMPENAKPNTKISLGPLGTLWLNRVTHTATGIVLHMIDLHVNKAEDGVAKGSDIVIANAQIGVHR